jgi:hypothetical protein
MPFSVEGTICTLVAAARLSNVVRPVGPLLQKLPKLTVTWVDPFVYVPSLWIVASEKRLNEKEVYGDLNVEARNAIPEKFLELGCV